MNEGGFNLRVKFSDGTDWNAQAVKWNLEQVKAGPANAATGAYWKSFEVIDDYTIKINFTVWQNRLLTAFGMPSSNQVSPSLGGSRCSPGGSWLGAGTW